VIKGAGMLFSWPARGKGEDGAAGACSAVAAMGRCGRALGTASVLPYGRRLAPVPAVVMLRCNRRIGCFRRPARKFMLRHPPSPSVWLVPTGPSAASAVWPGGQGRRGRYLRRGS